MMLSYQQLMIPAETGVIDEAITKATPKEKTFNVGEETFLVKPINPLSPVYALGGTTIDLYQQLNAQGIDTVVAMIEETGEPIGITKSFMNGAYKQLIEDKKIPYEKAYFFFNENTGNIVLHEAADNPENVMYIFNEKDL
ncbi:MAG: hypothetical protein ACMXYD_03300 [Candidatus Woesearchaeota archaeon]